jgi:hypothetical protein
MPLFNSPDRAARNAERERMFAEEKERSRQRAEQYKEEERARREQAPIREKQARIARTGYDQHAGRVNGKGGYGVTVHDDGTVSIGDREIGDYLETTLPGLHAELETLDAARDRVTVTRLVALGVFALAVPKRDRRRILALTGPGGFEAAVVVDATDEVHLRQWVAWLNRQGAQAAVRDEA